MLSLIVAHDENRAIGAKGALPWRLSEDLKRFRRLTMGHAILMGRKTYESIGRPLPGRRMVVITRDPDYRAEGCLVVHDLESAQRLLRTDDEPFVIGGAQIYRLTLPHVSRIYLTRVHVTVEDADAFFPPLDEGDWQRLESTSCPSDERNEFPTTFEIYRRAG